MRKRTDYTRMLVVALVLALGILVAFQIYLMREPSRIQAVLAADQTGRVARGETLFADQCATCHGKQGEGDIGPALNAKKYLSSVDDGQIFENIQAGVPGTGMPAWAQEHGGPLTHEQILDVVAFIRHWEPTAQDAAKPKATPDPNQGKAIFGAICYACHGANGEGTARAPALNSKELLTQFDDAWLQQTITQGRPSKGMPTWGTVLSPEQINSLVAYIRSWEATAPVIPTPGVNATPAGGVTPSASASPAATETPLPNATETVTATEAAGAAAEIARPSNGNLTPGPAITENIAGDPQAGAQVFVDNCKKCHGDAGQGGVDNPGSTDGTVPPLNPIDETLVSKDQKVFATNIDLFIEHGSTPEGDNPKQVMDAWGDTGKLSKQQIADVIAYIISLNK